MQMLELWERGAGLSAARRGLLLLDACHPGVASETLACLSIGERNRQLLTLRTLLFGPRIASVADCPVCRVKVELAFEAADLHAAPEGGDPRALALTAGEFQVQFRVPNSADLLAIESAPELGTAQERLLRACVSELTCHDRRTDPAELPPEVVQAIAARMEAADPQADIQLGLSCPECGYSWKAPFDIVNFLWSEINHWAERALREVHALALAYGWSETEVLALSPWRRHLYLDMIGG